MMFIKVLGVNPMFKTSCHVHIHLHSHLFLFHWKEVCFIYFLEISSFYLCPEFDFLG